MNIPSIQHETGNTHQAKHVSRENISLHPCEENPKEKATIGFRKRGKAMESEKSVVFTQTGKNSGRGVGCVA